MELGLINHFEPRLRPFAGKGALLIMRVLEPESATAEQHQEPARASKGIQLSELSPAIYEAEMHDESHNV
ncbi:MAG: hypothetical protein ACT4TC_16965 [Myxococcaceae bacterium]